MPNIEQVYLGGAVEPSEQRSSAQNRKGLKRDLGTLQSYATIIGIFIGAGAFVVTARAGADAGPSVPLAYLLMGPIILATSVSYIVYLSTPLGVRPGGAYIHISRTFGYYYPGFIAMWMKLVGFLGALSVLAVSFADYTAFFLTGDTPAYFRPIVGSLCLTLLYAVNILGVRYYGWMQTIMSLVLLIAVALMVIPGLFHVDLANYTPFLPYGWNGFFTAMATLFFGYAGFESLAQTAGETRNPRKTLPRVFLNGILISVAIYVLIAFVAFGVLPYQELAISDSAMADVASVYLPVGAAGVVALGALMAFMTSINGSILVPSRTLMVFAEDRVLPEFKFLGRQADRWQARARNLRGLGSTLFGIGALLSRGLGGMLNLAAVSDRFRTPHMSLGLCLSISLVLIWTETIDYMLNVALQGIFILYVFHAIALMCLPYVQPELYRTARIRFTPAFLIIAGLFSMSTIIWFSKELFTSDPRVLGLIGLWLAIGTLLYLIARWEGRKDGFDYDQRLVEEWQQPDSGTKEISS